MSEKNKTPTSNDLKTQVENLSVAAVLEKIQPALDLINKALDVSLPYLVKAYEKGVEIYNYLPLDIMYALIGLLLAFFGGTYCLLIAAVETFYLTGYPQVREGVKILVEEFSLIWKKSKEDDQRDDDHDGVADIKQMNLKDLAIRKISLYLENCRDPQQVMSILAQISSSIISVIAVLKVEFAKVIALGAMIGNCLNKPAGLFLVPALTNVIPSKYHKWINPIVEICCKSVAISLAWLVQRVISSVQSAIRGGLLFSRKIFSFLKKQGFLPNYSEDDYFDEVLGWFVALIGIYFQLSYGFGLPFPLNLLFFPLSLVESYVGWVVSS